HSLRLAEHHAGEGDTPTVRVVEKMERRVSIADTDYGEELALRIADLRELMQAYRDGEILEK
ncbi:MAG: fructose-bisphosphatase class III, partial [Clostridia bacterium]|nr:fructose-bisphosphatase class III [Clostridia bacterium]